MNKPETNQHALTSESPKAETVNPDTAGNVVAGVVLQAGTGVSDAISAFEFTDYREYLSAFYQQKRAKNPSYSMSSFTRRAGLGENSRGYLKLVIEGKRNLTSTTVRRFIDALGLKGREALYFENLVFFNQAKNGKDKQYYFERLEAAADGKRSQQFELLKAHFHYHSRWYYVAIRELVGLATFNEDPKWIMAALRNKVSRKEAEDALQVLQQIVMIRRDETGRLVQTEPLVKYTGGTFNQTMYQFHLDMMERAKEALINDPFEEKSGSGVTISCDHSKISAIKREIDIFRDKLNLQFGIGSTSPDTVFQVNIQFFQLTPIKNQKPEGANNK